jgi:hypothetical protein
MLHRSMMTETGVHLFEIGNRRRILMSNGKKTKVRGFVMTGGGAKGLYEAGVIHAFHITGMEFDVITGSSIGAMNAIFFGEYLYRKRQLLSDVQSDPEGTVEAMNDMVKAFHHAWLLLPEVKVLDDSETGPIGKLKDDLKQFNISLPQITQLAWWWTDPDRGSVPSPGVWTAILKLGKEFVERLGGAGDLLRIIKFHRSAPVQEAVRAYLRKFGLERSLVPPADDRKIRDVFVEPVTPLRGEHLSGNVMPVEDEGVEMIGLVDPSRTLRDYAREGIDVRVTRANYRTGRLEISAYLSNEDFVRYMKKQAWRLQRGDADSLPLGSFRLQLPGNPNAVKAALASGRFPGVFLPYPITEIYPLDEPENTLLEKMLSSWLDDPEAVSQMEAAFRALNPDGDQDGEWDNLLGSWKDSLSMREFFPNLADTYVDGGAIDNTPSNSAIDAVREWAEREGISKRDLVLDLYVVWLHPEPKIDMVDVDDPALHQVVGRTLEISGAAKLSSDAVVVDTINTFGKRGEDLGRALKVLLENLEDGLPDEGKAALQDGIREAARESGLRGFLGRKSEGILGRMADWTDDILERRLPVHVEKIKIFPEEMPLSTLQFTERFGYRKDNAIKMLTMGCYNTLWALRKHFEEQAKGLDEQDQIAFQLVKKWMDIEQWPKAAQDVDGLVETWRCQRTNCVFHERYCRRGASVAE